MPNTITLQNAYDALLRRKKDISDVPTATFIEWCDFLNREIYRHLCAVDATRFLKSYTLNVVAGTQKYAIPTDFRDIETYDTGIFEIDTNGVQLNRRLARTNFGDLASVGYYLDGNYIALTPTPTVSKPWTLRYIPYLDTVDSLSDTFIDPVTQEYLKFVVDALVVYYDIWDEDLNVEAIEDQRYVRALDELSRTIKREGYAYSTPDYSNIF